MEATGQFQASGLGPGGQASDDQWTGGCLELTDNLDASEEEINFFLFLDHLALNCLNDILVNYVPAYPRTKIRLPLPEAYFFDILLCSNISGS